MSPATPVVGHCPECGAPVAAHRILVEYETDDGPAAYADCPDCGAVVHPVSADVAG